MAPHPYGATHSITGTFYRMIFSARQAEVLTSVSSPEGRSHYDGQPTLYLSETAEGTAVAVKRYMQANDPTRIICPLLVTNAHIVDLRDTAACDTLGIDTSNRSTEWQSLRAKGLRSPTWDISDRVRALGLDGMLYASRTRPDLTHLTLFKWNALGGPKVTQTDAPIPFPMPSDRD